MVPFEDHGQPNRARAGIHCVCCGVRVVSTDQTFTCRHAPPFIPSPAATSSLPATQTQADSTFCSREERLGRRLQILLQAARLIEADGGARNRPTIERKMDAGVKAHGPCPSRVLRPLEVRRRPESPPERVGTGPVTAQEPVLQVVERKELPCDVVGGGAVKAGAGQSGRRAAVGYVL